MSTFNVTRRKTLPDTGTKTDLHDMIDGSTDGAQVTVSGLVNADIAANADIVDTKLAQITTANKVASTAITDGALNVAAVTCDSVSVAANGGVKLTEGTAPTTAASVGAIYTKDTGGQPELFFREESDGDEVQITSGGVVVASSAVTLVEGTTDITTNSTSYVDMTTMTATVGAGKFNIDFVAPMNSSSSAGLMVNILIDTVQKAQTTYLPYDVAQVHPITLHWYEEISGAGVIKIQWKKLTSGTASQTATSWGSRILRITKVGA